MTPETQLRQALRTPRALEDVLRVVHGFAAEGRGAAEVYRWLQALLDEAGREMGEDERRVVLQVMDVTCGHCPPEHRLWPEDLPRLHAPGATPVPV